MEISEHGKDKRDSKATSKETVHDLEDKEELTDQKKGDSVKSPDGSFDEDNEAKDAGPI